MKRRVVDLPALEPKPTSEYEVTILAAELGTEVPEVDLHGQSIAEAIREVEFLIYSNHPPGTEVVKIIHGRGEQRLRNAIHAWLKQKKDIPYFRDAQGQGQQGGVTFVVLP